MKQCAYIRFAFSQTPFFHTSEIRPHRIEMIMMKSEYCIFRSKCMMNDWTVASDARNIDIHRMASNTNKQPHQNPSSSILSAKHCVIQPYNMRHTQLLWWSTHSMLDIVVRPTDPLPLYRCHCENSYKSPSPHTTPTGSGGSMFTNFWIQLIATAHSFMWKRTIIRRARARAHLTITYQQQQQQQSCMHRPMCWSILWLSVVIYSSFSSV